MEDKKKILIVEDEDNMLSLLKYNLSKEDFDVYIARDGREGLEKVKSGKPDLIVSDVMMPNMDGFEFCRNLRKDPETRTIPFIFLTARGQLPDKLEGLQTGADDYITKPFVPKELVAMVHARLNRTDVYKELADSDRLTGLFNKKALEQNISAEIVRAKRLNIPLSLGFLDIDLFRKVNERFGHEAGDEAIRGVASVIKNSLETDDIAGRFGGEEFIIVLPNKVPADAFKRLEELRIRIANISFHEHDLKVAVSIGSSTFPQDAEDMKGLIKKSDEALYRAKKTGRNRTVVFSRMAYGGGNDAK